MNEQSLFSNKSRRSSACCFHLTHVSGTLNLTFSVSGILSVFNMEHFYAIQCFFNVINYVQFVPSVTVSAHLFVFLHPSGSRMQGLGCA